MNTIYMKSLHLSLVVYSIIIGLILYIKPTVLFKNDNELKYTGFGKNKTLFSFPIFVIVISILIYFTITYFLL